jgi:hypothetical protein
MSIFVALERLMKIRRSPWQMVVFLWMDGMVNFCTMKQEELKKLCQV